MYSNYFDRLRCKTREIDAGIEKLTDTWKMPRLLVGGYAERTPETDAHLEELWTSIRCSNDGVEQLNSELKASVDEADELLKSSLALYEELKEQCDNLDIVLGEYGYHYDESNNESEDNSRNSNQDYMNNTNNTSLTTEEEPEMEVEFTPNLAWKQVSKSKVSNSLDGNQTNFNVKGIATPVIKSLKSVLQYEVFNKKE
ncbi:hypothetical protein PUN28_015824 [Cardiocondyla obscurior]|uniref:Uncharacterized protein n=1 Tax=Cardiocondyla obscurior TaxID=286306 RepID=A0AAW2ES22_9HYME